VAHESDPYLLFHSAETGLPFLDCIACGLRLADPELPYLVSKSFRRGECIFEYAICDVCRTNMAREFSTESRQRLNEFFENRVKVHERSSFLAYGLTPEPWIERCAACNTPRSQAESYSIGGVLLGQEMLFDPYPLCLCGKCEEEIQERLSKKTRGIWDDFVDTHFDGPPAGAEHLPRIGRPMVV
jgi:hypothetical protein